MKQVWMILLLACIALQRASAAPTSQPSAGRFLYVATPGVCDDVKAGGVGIAVFDIDHEHHFVRRIRVPALGDEQHPKAAKGICASAATARLYVSTPADLSCLDLANDQVLWTRRYENGCDRMSISPDGNLIYEPTLEGAYWHVIDADTGDEIAKVNTGSGSHNTVFSRDGRRVFLAGLHSPLLSIVDSASSRAIGAIGPFSAAIRPFTVNGRGTLVYVCVNDLLGFEVGDVNTRQKLWRVEVTNFPTGAPARHGCPSHGVGLTPDEKEVWLADGPNHRLHIFDNFHQPPRQDASIELRDEPGWITFGIDGRFAYPSTGEVISVADRKIIARLVDEAGRSVESEKLLEIDFSQGKVSRAGDQFGVGGVLGD